jgi:farnesyl-diphosphate farnesyltransferase
MPEDANAKASPVSDSGESPDVLPLSHQQRQKRLQRLLRGVSRTFYLSLTVLPKGLREPVGLTYLLARAADTIADTRLLPPDHRLGLLLSFRDQVRGPAQLPALEKIKDALTEAQAIPEERTLLESLPEFLEFLESLPEDDRRLVRTVLATLTYGMEGDLINFPHEDSGEIAALERTADLEKYLYHVAGCVGEFWTEISAAHAAGLNGWDPGAMAELGVAYGKALQLTNILRDLPRDLRIGRCYLPIEQLEPLGLEPPDLLNAEMGPRALPALSQGIRTALGYYADGEEYLLAIPRRCVRLRLAALWPMLIGLATLSRLAQDAQEGLWLEPERPSRVSRKWVYRTIALSLPAVVFNPALKFWVHRLRRSVESKLS